MTDPQQPIQPPSLIQNLRALFEDTIDLFRKEIELAKAEFSEKLSQAQSGLTMIFCGLLLCAVATFLLAQALVAWLAIYLGPAGAALAIGAAVLLFGVIALWIGAARLKPQNLKPVRTIRATSENATQFKETFNDKIK